VRPPIRERGQSLVESAIVLIIFLAMVLGVLDCGQVLFAHQSLVARVNSALRWGITHPGESPDAIANLVLYNQADEPRDSREGYLGLKRENVIVEHQSATTERPDDELLTIRVVNFEAKLVSPWIARPLVSARPVIASAPLPPRAAATDAADAGFAPAPQSR
jgi:hypothetical protein